MNIILDVILWMSVGFNLASITINWKDNKRRKKQFDAEFKEFEQFCDLHKKKMNNELIRLRNMANMQEKYRQN